MKKIIFLLILIVIGCNNSEKFDYDKISNNLRKYMFSENLFFILNLEKDKSEINIDSIVKISKYNYLEKQIEVSKEINKRLKSDKKSDLLNVFTIKLNEKQTDSLIQLYINSDKSDLYYKCFTSIFYKNDSLINKKITFILDENFNIIDRNLFDYMITEINDEEEIIVD